LEWKYGFVADTAGGKIIAWRHPSLPLPTETELDQADADYDAFLTSQAAAFNGLKGMIAARLAITVTNKVDLRAKRAAIYDALDQKEADILAGPGAVEGKLNSLRQLWNVRNKLEAELSR